MKIIEIVILVIMLLGVLIGLKKGAVKEIFELYWNTCYSNYFLFIKKLFIGFIN